MLLPVVANRAMFVVDITSIWELPLTNPLPLVSYEDVAAFNDVLIYDYYWRLLRNYSVRSIADLNAMGVEDAKILWVIRKMLNVQMKFPLSLLKIGPISKLLMFSCYLARPKNK